MIGKVMHNSSFRATTGYVLEKSGATLIGGSIAGESVRELVAEFMWSHDLNPALKHPVWHDACLGVKSRREKIVVNFG